MESDEPAMFSNPFSPLTPLSPLSSLEDDGEDGQQQQQQQQQQNPQQIVRVSLRKTCFFCFFFQLASHFSDHLERVFRLPVESEVRAGNVAGNF